MIAKSLARLHWNLLLEGGCFAIASIYRDDGEFFEQMLSPGTTPNRVTGGLGERNPPRADTTDTLFRCFKITSKFLIGGIAGFMA